MNDTQLIERSKNKDKINFDSITCVNDPNPLVPVHSTGRLLVEPIWEKPIDDLEGPLYQDYIKKNPGYNQLYLRQEVISRLLQAAKNLPKEWKLIVRAGHRPSAVQQKLLQSLIDEYMEKHPDGTPTDALEFARIYVSDPAIKLPPHCCGAAVDVDVLEVKNGRLVDFGCPVNTDSDIAYLHSNKVSKTQHSNRLTLLSAMLQAGFASYYAEWWHFSYGDQIWAYFYKKPQALYGIVEPNI